MHTEKYMAQENTNHTHILHLKTGLNRTCTTQRENILLYLLSFTPPQSFSWFRRLQLFLILLSVMLDALELYDYSCVCVCVCAPAICSHLAPSQGKWSHS